MSIRALATGALTIALLTSVGCAGDDPLIYMTGNGLMDQQRQCKFNPKVVFPIGRLDVADQLSSGASNPRSYLANFVVQTNVLENENIQSAGSYTNYGSVSTNEILIEEMEIEYDFTVAATPPAGQTLDLVPQRSIYPVQAHLGPESKAGEQGEAGSTIVAAPIVATAVSDSLNADPDIFSLLEYPNSYPMAARIRLRGRTVGGQRLETDQFTYPIEVCRGCLVNNLLCQTNDCYPEWQDCPAS